MPPHCAARSAAVFAFRSAFAGCSNGAHPGADACCLAGQMRRAEVPLQTRVIRQLRRPVSEIGLGCWQLGGGFGPMDEAQAMRILDTAMEQDISFFDTADVYGDGRSELLLGRMLKISRKRPFVATKVGRFPVPGWPDNFRPEVMRRHVEASLRRLGVDAIDLVQLHCVPREQLQSGEMFGTLARMRDEGKLRAYGASVETVEEGLLCLETPGIASLQIIFNLLRQSAADELLPRAAARRVAIIARLPLASGVLTGRFGHDTTFHATDHRSYNRDGAAFHVGETFAGLPFEVAIDLAEQLDEGFRPMQYTMAEFAQRFILDHQAVTTVITGASNPEQVYDNAGVSDLPPLDENVHAGLRAFYDEEVVPHIRGGI